MNAGSFDIIVVGGGHAGIEAALAAARLGARCALVTHDKREVGRMPCNPAIGGLGKGHLVREIDVLGGEMAVAIDDTGIQFRVLNRKKGPAVQSPRAQADKHAYQARMEAAVLDQGGLEVIEGDVSGILTRSGSVTGVILADGRAVSAGRVVLCSGTFLKGLMHVGDSRTTGGREGAASSEGLSGDLGGLGFNLKRLKTGTPPRLRRDSIDYSCLQAQRGDDPPTPFSFRTRNFDPNQIACYLAYTNQKTHAVISASLDRSPLYGGSIAGQGPRYCPSIEDKVVRFADKDRHLLFLEPEGVDSDEVYVNGMSTSLPADAQEAVVRTVPGLEKAEIVRFGYAVEYDSIPSWQVEASLEAKPVRGLYLAGQILGTSGYEEAAAQGLVAGVNAVRSLDGSSPFQLGRNEAYIGVLVDDLVTKEINEPYRMFTSRAEHRLHLRCDNAETRLLDAAGDLGLLSGSSLEVLKARKGAVHALDRLLRKTSIMVPERGLRLPAVEYLRYPGSTIQGARDLGKDNQEFSNQFNRETDKLRSLGGPHVVGGALAELENAIKYDGYITKHNKLLRHREHLDHLELPADIDYLGLSSLSHEAREKLQKVRPATLGQAGRIDGVRAADIAVLTVIMKKIAAGPGGTP